MLDLKKGLNQYLDFLRFQKNLSPHTIDSYKRDIVHLLQYLQKTGVKSIEEINVENFRRYIRFLDNFSYANRTIIRKYSSFINYFKFLEKKGIMANNLSQQLIPPQKNQRFFSFLSIAEACKLMASIDLDSDAGKRDKALLELMYSTGARINEIESIKLNDIDLSNQEIKVIGKGNKQRIVYINRSAYDSLQNYLKIRNNFLFQHQSYKQSKFLFLNFRGGPLSARGIRNIIKKYVLKSDIKKNITPHSLRHSFASHMLQRGANIREIQELLGHENISTTQIYTHLNIKKLKQDYQNFHPRAK